MGKQHDTVSRFDSVPSIAISRQHERADSVELRGRLKTQEEETSVNRSKVLLTRGHPPNVHRAFMASLLQKNTAVSKIPKDPLDRQ